MQLHGVTADQTPEDDASFHGAVAVNALQLCEPADMTARALARLLKPGAELVSITHDWAAAPHAGSAQAWLRHWSQALANAGFTAIETPSVRAQKGNTLALVARRGM